MKLPFCDSISSISDLSSIDAFANDYDISVGYFWSALPISAKY